MCSAGYQCGVSILEYYEYHYGRAGGQLGGLEHDGPKGVAEEASAGAGKAASAGGGVVVFAHKRSPQLQVLVVIQPTHGQHCVAAGGQPLRPAA